MESAVADLIAQSLQELSTPKLDRADSSMGHSKSLRAEYRHLPNASPARRFVDSARAGMISSEFEQNVWVQ